MTSERNKPRRPAEAIAYRTHTSMDCEKRVRAALTKLVKTGAPFTVESVCVLAGVGKTFIYDKRRPELIRAVLAARDASQAQAKTQAEQQLDKTIASWRERALNAEAVATSLRKTLKERNAQISDLTGELYDPDGNHLAERNAELRNLLQTLTQTLRQTESDNLRLQRSLDAARANVKRERERNVAIVGPKALSTS